MLYTHRWNKRIIMQLYKIDFPNNKSYIGISSVSAKSRFKDHCQKRSKSLVSVAIRKYGKDNVTMLVIGECDDWELLCLAEQEAISKYNTKSPCGYNLTCGGDGCIGRENASITEETRSRISAGRLKVGMPRGIKISVMNATSWAKRKGVPFSCIDTKELIHTNVIKAIVDEKPKNRKRIIERKWIEDLC